MVAVELLPALVTSVLVQPVVLPVLMAALLAMPAIVKVRVGSTFACTWTDSIVAILDLAVSISTLFPSWVLIVTNQVSAVPAAAVLAGLIRVGDWVVQDAPELAVQPIRKVITVLADTAAVVVQVIVGAATEIVHDAPLTLILVPVSELSPLKAKVVAEGEAVLLPAPGKVIRILPPEGMGLGLVNFTVCMAVIGTIIGSPEWWVLAGRVVK